MGVSEQSQTKGRDTMTQQRIVLGGTYRNNDSGHILKVIHVDTLAGKINARVIAHNATTDQDEAWSTRLFLATHTRQH